MEWGRVVSKQTSLTYTALTIVGRTLHFSQLDHFQAATAPPNAKLCHGATAQAHFWKTPLLSIFISFPLSSNLSHSSCMFRLSAVPSSATSKSTSYATLTITRLPHFVFMNRLSAHHSLQNCCSQLSRKPSEW